MTSIGRILTVTDVTEASDTLELEIVFLKLLIKAHFFLTLLFNSCFAMHYIAHSIGS